MELYLEARHTQLEYFVDKGKVPSSALKSTE
jgi:hypothetical protein